ncbi:hypothetical protein [Sporolactobacillus sp. KGMB 08714]|uniref:hypothetical protein n=1 Tax=Sporolactobacillus sp. KGMB 08714 TaxID=3064704 RepID=UPI002FBDFF9A
MSVKRIVIEMLVIFSVLMLCVLYGAVTVRDAQSINTQTNVQTGNSRSTAAQPGASSSSGLHPAAAGGMAQTTAGQNTSIKSPRSGSAAVKNTGEAFSNKVSRLFLWGVGQVAGMVRGVIQGSG